MSEKQTYRVFVQMMVSAVVDVEAGSVDEALENYYDSPEMPGSITIGAFGSASVDESGEWEASEVIDASGKTVWTEKDA